MLNEENLLLLNQLLQALNEFCIGNYKNREVTFNENTVFVINFILQIDITNIKKSRHSGNVLVITHTTATDEIGISEREPQLKIDYPQLRKLALEMKASAVQL